MVQIDLDARLASIIAPVVTAMGLELVRIQLSGQPGSLTLQVMAEDPATGQLTLDQCAALSRALDLPLEEADPIDGEYALEVSSPGIDRPLTRLHDFVEWGGFEARITVTEAIEGRKTFKGILGGVEGEDIQFRDTKVGDVVIPFDLIDGAKLVLTDALISATMPLSSDGADEFETEE